VTAFVIDTERTSFAVSFRPGIPGIGATVSGVRGVFDAAVDDAGVVDWTEAVHGSFIMHVDDLQMGNRMFTTASRQVLSRALDEPISGTLRDVEPDPARLDHFTAAIFIRFGDRDVPLRGQGRFEATDDGFRVAGTSLVDPRSFGVPLPPLLNLVCTVRWRIHLTHE
jgi:hypothetical protein